MQPFPLRNESVKVQFARANSNFFRGINVQIHLLKSMHAVERDCFTSKLTIDIKGFLDTQTLSDP